MSLRIIILWPEGVCGKLHAIIKTSMLNYAPIVFHISLTSDLQQDVQMFVWAYAITYYEVCQSEKYIYAL